MPTQNLYAVRIPRDVRDTARGLKLEIPLAGRIVPHTITPSAELVRISLGTHDPRLQKSRKEAVRAYLSTVWNALRSKHGVPLTHRQAVALSKTLYAAWADERQTTRHTEISLDMATRQPVQEPEAGWLNPEHWAGVLPSVEIGDDDLEKALGPLLDRLLLRKGISALDPASRPMVLYELRNALRYGLTAQDRKLGGDYSPDPKATRFPAWEEPKATVEGSNSLRGLVEDWWKEARKAGRAANTVEAYRSSMRGFVAFLEHDDPHEVTQADVVRFKDQRLDDGISPKTVSDSDLAALRSVFGWAVDNGRMRINPAEGVKVLKGKPTKLREKSFTDEEAAAILAHALAAVRGKQETEKRYLARRWVPWLMAYNGARVGEIAQLRKQDVHRVGKMVVLRITPEAGTVKDKEARKVVAHQHLIELGFMEMVEGCKTDRLFLPDTPMLISAQK